MVRVVTSLVVCVLVIGFVESAIWHDYRKVILNSAQAMINLLKCINDLEDCSPIEAQVKDVFRSFYTKNCRDCCRKRKKMVKEMMEYWENNGMTNEDEMRQHFVS